MATWRVDQIQRAREYTGHKLVLDSYRLSGIPQRRSARVTRCHPHDCHLVCFVVISYVYLHRSGDVLEVGDHVDACVGANC